MTATFSAWPRHVYVASDGADRHKIGLTTNLQVRRYHLGRDLGRRVEIVHSEPLSPDADAVECAAHWLLADRHEGREWFTVTKAEAVAALETAKAQVRAGDLPTSRLVMVERYGLAALVALAVSEACEPGESPADFIRQAIEAELKRRSRQKP